ncbi:MAG: ActS/PrrB/RegB family redox-sensitive histidine kinase [Hyphomicrobiaceae bacterium]|nr:ActS/PrrB/RegB family redox-sensitive histidine kinase [Hyphomicrobiaceae bacterium]
MQRRLELGELIERAQPSRGRVRLATTTTLRWMAVAGQLAAIGFVSLYLGFEVPLAYCLSLIALSAWLNVILTLRLPARHRLSNPVAAALIGFDLLQLTGLLYFTGGIGNPFIVLLVAPVAVSAATLPVAYTVVLGTLAMVATFTLTYEYWPLPWYRDLKLELPVLYKNGVFAAVLCSVVFIALYVRRLAKEGRDMSTALAATELVLAREQKLHALDGLAAAAAHELGTPLATIVLTVKELERELGPASPHAEDMTLLRTQAERCRDILRTLTRSPTESDPMHASLSVRELVDDAAGPYIDRGKIVSVVAGPAEANGNGSGNGSGNGNAGAPREPIGARQPGVIFALRNIVENAVDFAKSRVEIRATWSPAEVVIEIADDGPGFPPDLMDSLGDPYVTTRGSNVSRRSGGTGRTGGGLGLGFFIAKTLLERSGGSIELTNGGIGGGALVRISWPYKSFVAEPSWPPPRPA